MPYNLDRQETVIRKGEGFDIYVIKYMTEKSTLAKHPLEENVCILSSLNIVQNCRETITQSLSPIMAGSTPDNEKQEVNYIEHVETNESSMNLHKEQTLSGVDMKNTSAVKGDDSDGKVIWSMRSKFSAIFLAALYTGMPAVVTQASEY